MKLRPFAGRPVVRPLVAELGKRHRSGGVGGGAPAPSGMLLGMNVGPGSTSQGGVHFANLAHQMSGWDLQSGSPTWSQDQGILTSSDLTSAFRAYVSDQGLGLPLGTYTVTWAGAAGASIGFGEFSNQSISAYTTTQGTFTFTWDGTKAGLFVWAKGSITDLRIIIPGHVASYAAGNPWNQQFLDFHTTLGASPLRLMDMTSTNLQLDENWSDRVQPNKISFWFGGGTMGTFQLPWEFGIDLCNRLQKNAWICIPHRSTLAYKNSCAAMWKDGTGVVAVPNCGSVGAGGLDSNLRLLIELGNENIWNDATPWALSSYWVLYLDHTRYTATVNAATNVITRTAHGLVDGDILRGFWTRTQRANNLGLGSPMTGSDGFYLLAFAQVDLYVEALDANTFSIYQDVGRTTIYDLPTGMTDFLYIKKNEAGKVADGVAHHCELSEESWNAFVTAMGSTRAKKVLAAQSANATVAANRLAALGTPPDYLAIAPYFSGQWFGAQIDTSTGAFTYKFWGNRDMTVYYSVWSNASSPQRGQGMAGTGVVASSGAVAHTASATGSWTTAYAPTGFVNGTTYKHLITVRVQDNDGRYYFYDLPIQTIAATASVTSTTVVSSTSDQGLRSRVDTIAGNINLAGQLEQIAAHIATAGGIPVICYEGGCHLHEVAPAELTAWKLDTYQESSDFAVVISTYLYAFAAAGVDLFCYFGDVFGREAGNVFSIANDYGDTADEGFQAIADFAGGVPVRTPLTIQTLAADRIAAAPSYPHVAYTLPSGYTYAVLAEGAELGNFTVVGNELRMVAGSGISFAAAGTQTVRILGHDGYQDNLFIVDIPTGPETYYDATDLFAWSPVDDTNTTQVNPDRGNTISVTAGSAASAAGGYWNLANGGLYSAFALTAAPDVSTKDFMVAVVKAIGTASSSGAQALQVGTFGTAWVRFQSDAATSQMRWNVWNGTDVDEYGPMPFDSTKRCYFFHYDHTNNKIRYGYDSTYVNASGAAGDTPLHAIAAPNDVLFIGDQPTVQGSLRVVNLSTINTTDLATVVSKLRTKHGL